MIALQKPRGGVRGISDVVRRLVARTMAQNFSKAVEAATAPHQDAMSTRVGECVVHVLHVLTELTHKPLLCPSFPFVRSFYGQFSRYVWEDELGSTRRRGRKRGTLSSLGQHAADYSVEALRFLG